MTSLLHLLGSRLVPAVLVAAGVVLITAGLLSYADPTVAGPGPAASDTAVIETLAPTDEPTGEPASPTATASGSPAPSPSGSSGPSASPSAAPSDAPPASIRPDPTRKPGRVVATRVVVPALKIDLPVVKGNDGYPYCNVAMYLHTANAASRDAFGQPGEGRATYLYAHARDGMFGPIYELAIQRKNARKMLGMLVQVYTSDFKLHLYEIREYRLHATDLDRPLGADSEELWLQTSEGPKGTPGKTQLRAVPVSVSDADPRDAVPKARPVRCG